MHQRRNSTGLQKERQAVSPSRSSDLIVSDLIRTVQPPSVNEVATAVLNLEGDDASAEDPFVSTLILTKDQLKLKSVDFYTVRENLKSQRKARASNQKEISDRLNRGGTGSVEGLSQTVSPSIAMRRMRKGIISNS